MRLNRNLISLKLYILNKNPKYLAEKLGVNYSTFWRWLQGESEIPAAQLYRLSKILKEPMETLIKQKAPDSVERVRNDPKNKRFHRLLKKTTKR